MFQFLLLIALIFCILIIKTCNDTIKICNEDVHVKQLAKVSKVGVEENLLVILFYDKYLMPCCKKPIKYQEGPSAGLTQNIRCSYCMTEWNISNTFGDRFIEKI